jgi:hypothetical protein
MADAVGSVAPAEQQARRETSLQKRRRDDLWLAISALGAALMALPLAPSSWHGPEVSATLAIAATAMFAGQRWSIAVIVLAELLLLPTVWPRAFLSSSDVIVRVAALGSVIAIVPGLLSIRRAAAALVLVSGWQRTSRTCRRAHAVLVAIGVVAGMLPIL